MKQEQEQKPFEIKEEFRGLSVDEIIRLCGKCGDWDSMTVLHLIAYIKKSNAEIRRLQEQVLGFERDTTDWQLEVANLRQQLADAPTWGKWQDATVENIEDAELEEGFYEFEWDNGATELLLLTEDLRFINISGTNVTSLLLSDEDGVPPVRFRRLNYEPKPAREVEPPEKTYDYGGVKFTASDMAKPGLWSDAVHELARDLLAVQAELRELKGER